MGGAFLVSAAQSSFVNVLTKVLPHSAPNVNPMQVVLTGATELRDVFTPEEIPGILVAYMRGLKISFALSLAATGLAFVISLATKLKRLNTDAIKGGGAA